MGSLDVEVGDAHGAFHSIWRKAGSQGDDWKTASMQINSTSVAVRLVAITGGWSSDIAVDDIQLMLVPTTSTTSTSTSTSTTTTTTTTTTTSSTTTSTTTTTTTTSTTTSSITIAALVHPSCGFEDQCPWTNEGEISWTVRSGQTPSSGTGPFAAATGANYVYVEASSPNNPNKIAILVLDATQSYTLTFAYHMKGSSMGSLDVEVGDAHGAFHSIWRKAGSQGDDWKTASMQINSTSVAVRLVAITGGWSSDIAVDDIQLTPTKPWLLVKGECTVDADGCILSPNYGGSNQYSNNQECEFDVMAAYAMEVEDFQVEDGDCDYLKVNGKKYSGTSSPHGEVPANKIAWYSDFSVTHFGWKICPKPA